MSTAIEASRQFMAVSRHLPRLLDLADAELQLMQDFEAAYEQDPPDEEALARISAEFVGNEALVIQKLENYLALDEKFTMFEQAFKARAAELRELAAIAERNRERLRARLLVAMQVMGRDKVVTPSGVVRRQLNAVSCVVTDRALIPSEFMRQPPIPERQPDLVAIKAAGVPVPGTELVRKESLRIS